MSKNIEQYTGEEILGAVIDNSNRIADRQVYKSLGEFHETLREYAQPISDLAIEVQKGKQEMVNALAMKNVQSSTNKTLSAIADDVRSIAQEPITISGGKIYEEQLFGAATDKTLDYSQPNSPMWNLYQVMVNLLNDGRFATCGGILLAEYSKGDSTISLQGAGAGGAYLTSDGAMYESDISHTWNDGLDGKSNRWVAYIFKNEYSQYIVPTVELCPITIHVGRQIGKIIDNIGGKITEIVVSEGSYLDSVELIAENWGGNTRISNLGNFVGTLFAGGSAVNVSAGIKNLTGGNVWAYISDKIESITLPELEIINGGFIFNTRNPKGNMDRLKSIHLPKLTTISSTNRIYDTFNSSNILALKEWNMPNLRISNVKVGQYGIVAGPYCTKVVVGAMETNLVLDGWGISINPNPEVELINKNIRLYIADRVSDRTGLSPLTVIFSTSIYAILEQETKDAFTAKNWSIASA